MHFRLGPLSLSLPLLLAVVLLLVFGHYGSEAKMPGKGAVAAARKEDVKYIKCGVCEEIVKQLHRQVKKKKEAIAPKKLTELEIINLTENICDIKKEEADWLMYLDIVEDGPRLKLVEQQEEGECNSECKTIERACQEVMGDHDTDVAELLYKGEVQRSALSRLLCKDLSKACARKPPALPKEREPGPPFAPKASKDAEMARLMRSMGDMPGAPGMQMYSRDELQNGAFGMGGEDGDDDDDDDDDDADDDQLQEQSLKAATNRQAGLVDQAQIAVAKLKIGVQTAVSSAAHHVSKVSSQVKEWWYGTKSSTKRKASKRSARVRPQKATKSEL